jgi:hypothetical protein
MIGLTAPGALLPVLVLMTVLGGFTAAQRLVSAMLQLGPTPASAPASRERVTKPGDRFDGEPRPGV